MLLPLYCALPESPKTNTFTLSSEDIFISSTTSKAEDAKISISCPSEILDKIQVQLIVQIKV